MTASATIVTPTRRLSQYLRVQHARQQVESGQLAWQTLDSLPWSAWCRRLYEQLALHDSDAPLLLGESQQRWLWQQIINRSSHREYILQVPAVARQAVQAYRLCKQWQIPVFPQAIFKSIDARAFEEWTNEYERQKQQNGWLDEASLPDHITQHLTLIKNDVEQTVFQGFDVLNTQQQRLIDTSNKIGIDINVVDIEQQNETVKVYKANDNLSEYRAAASWARNKLNENPDATIGIVSPVLRQGRRHVERCFTEVLSPSRVIDPHSVNRQAWSIALGKPLFEYPAIQTAMGILALGHRQVNIHELGRLLHSPFIKGADDELASRANLDAELRQAGETQITLKTLYRFVEGHEEKREQCRQFIQLIKDFEISFLSHAREQTLRQWAVVFSGWLSSFGWPGERSLNSDEHQTIEQWQEALAELGAMDPQARAVTYPVAVAQLRRLLQDKQFQPETPETPIQIAGLTGSAAMQFDYLWIMDMQDDVWPEPPLPNAFIPRQCQLDAGLPTVNAEAQLRYASLVTDRLVSSAREVVFSYSRQDGDRQCRPSPLIIPWLQQDSTLDVAETGNPQTLLFRAADHEKFLDTAGPALDANEQARGGSALFRDQSQCPFRAFARHRLHASSLAATDIGLSAAERGNLTHRVMQYLWQRLGDHETLLYRSADEISRLIQSVVSESIKQHRTRQPDTFSDRFAELEQRRLELLLHQWLPQERARAAFKVIATEDWHSVHFNGIELHLRIDRIDELEDGRYVIIDYKTGLVNKRDWESENPNDPQLPLYAVTMDHDIAALAYASLKKGKLGFQGLAENEDILPQVHADKDADWQQRLQEWQVVLQRLADDFKRGQATVEPLQGACRYCELPALCRINQRTEVLESELLAEGAMDD